MKISRRRGVADIKERTITRLIEPNDVLLCVLDGIAITSVAPLMRPSLSRTCPRQMNKIEL